MQRTRHTRLPFDIELIYFPRCMIFDERDFEACRFGAIPRGSTLIEADCAHEVLADTHYAVGYFDDGRDIGMRRYRGLLISR